MQKKDLFGWVGSMAIIYNSLLIQLGMAGYFKNYLNTVFFVFIGTCSHSQDSVSVTKYNIGNDTLTFHLSIYYPNSSQVSFINLHDDENTSVEAGLNYLSRYGGTLMQLQHGSKRRFRFMLNERLFSFDPNRIFTDDGIRSTLEKGGIFTPEAADEVKNIADSILINNVNGKKLVVALHNTKEQGLSILSYKKRGSEAANTAKLYINQKMNPHDFILTTENYIFHYLKKNRINVVLQVNTPVDDGSLSVYAARNKISYINIEALHVHLNEQVKMLEILKEIIVQY